MAVIGYNNQELKLLARLMRAEAEGDGQKGMLLVGNVVVNRALANCLDFKNINTIEKAVMQRPGGFEATMKSYFYQAAREQERCRFDGSGYQPDLRHRILGSVA